MKYLMVTVVLVFVLTGCGGNKETDTPAAEIGFAAHTPTPEHQQLEAYVIANGAAFLNELGKHVDALKAGQEAAAVGLQSTLQEKDRDGFLDNPSYTVLAYNLVLTDYLNAFNAVDLSGDLQDEEFLESIAMAKTDTAEFLSQVPATGSQASPQSAATPEPSATPEPTEASEDSLSAGNSDYATLAAKGKLSGIEFGIGTPATEIENALGRSQADITAEHDISFLGFDDVITYMDVAYLLNDGVVSGIFTYLGGSQTAQDFYDIFQEDHPDGGYYGNGEYYMQRFDAGDSYDFYMINAKDGQGIDYVILYKS
ncbi:hypothetical protein [Paenibacillus sp. NFR01]|uniref:hypothetical protein n=1 Tax=Paenibacillus sp. NFR01 TaxID=1566279 RepID=UPI0008CAC38D|nr:hypothetical protein [Paenibacillus sp. NFR01]SET61158.1 hypothetical protein SAMN03159358_2182 [Paenibacillus sp. NFR01]